MIDDGQSPELWYHYNWLKPVFMPSDLLLTAIDLMECSMQQICIQNQQEKGTTMAYITFPGGLLPSISTWCHGLYMASFGQEKKNK